MLDQSRPRGATALCPPALCFSLPMARLRLPPGAPARVSRFGGFRVPSGVISQGSWLSGPYVALTFLGHVGESICNSLRGIGEALSQRWHPSPLSCHQGQSFVTPLFVSRWRPHTQIPAVPDSPRPSHFGKFRVTLGLAIIVSFGHRTSDDKLISAEHKCALSTVRGARDTAAVRAAQQRPLKHGRREKRTHRRTTRRRSSTRRKA